MRIDSDSVVAGLPAREVRELLRFWKSGAKEGLIMARLGLPRETAVTVLESLVSEGYLTDGDNGDGFVRTIKGSALAQASAATPLRRTTVETKLQELIERMIHVNASNEFLWGIEDAFVYGSYLTDTDRLGDLDISVRLYRKESDPALFAAAAEKCIQESGRNFGNIVDRACWPTTMVFRHLKQRSRVFSIHQDELLLKHDPSIPRRAIFLNGRPSQEAAAPVQVSSRKGGHRKSRRRDERG